MKLLKYLTILIVAFGTGACTKLLKTDPPANQLREADAITSKEDVLEVVNSCYDVLANIYNGRIQYCNELLADDIAMQNESGDLGQIYNRNVSIFNGTVDGVYKDPYITVFRANRIDEFLEEFDFSEQEKAEVRAQLDVMRAASHFEVLKLWAQPYGYSANNSHNGIVYKTSTQVEVLPRESVAAVYNQIIADLENAINSGSLPNNNIYRITEDAARTWLAKVYFQKGDYANALAQAEQVINSGRYRLDTIIDRFQPNSVNVPEIIYRTRSFEATNDYRSRGFTDNYRSDVPQPPFLRASAEFYAEYENDTLDARLTQFFEVREPGTPEEYVAVKKFNKVFFDVPVLHLTDLKLLRAECLVLLNQNINTAIDDVNDIRERAYGNSSQNLGPGLPAAQVLDAIRKERRIEMFGEGDRVQQLKRRGAIEGENIIIRDAPWDCDGMILQFPAVERTELFEMNPQGRC